MTAAPSTPELASNRPTRLALSPAIGSASSVVLWMGDCKEVLPVGSTDLFCAVLQWHKGPAEGGTGTAGKDDQGRDRWWDGDRLLVETNHAADSKEC